MSNIQLYSKKNQGLSDVAFIESTHSHVKIRKADKYELSKALAHWITETSFALGIKDPISDFNKKDVVELVLNKFKNFSVDELYYAFKMERYGNLEPTTKGQPSITPHYQMFNAEYVNIVLEKYIIWKRKKALLHDISAPAFVATQTEGEKQYWINRGVLTCLEDYEEHGAVSFDRIYVYDILYDSGYLSKEVDFKKEMYAAAKEVVQMEYSTKKASNLKEQKDINFTLGQIHVPGNSKVKSKAKELVLNKFFRELTANENELSEFKAKYKF